MDAGSEAVDFAYLEGFAGGDRRVIDEVLALFLQQARVWAEALNASNPGWADVVHTVKGSARGIGANGLGETCAHCEAYGPEGLVAVRAGLAAVVAAIEAYQSR